MPHSPDRSVHRATRPYFVGLVLALILTAVPFGLLAARVLSPAPMLAVIADVAFAQIVVHLRFFLHLELKPSSRDRLLVLCFAAVLIVIMVGGSVWIMFDLDYRMTGR
jgi:cytochrome o ubiquinol oxidase operon protein cyoD